MRQTPLFFALASLLAAGCAPAPDATSATDDRFTEGASGAAWNVNDVSILYPRPTPDEAVHLLPMARATDAGEQVLLPEAVYKLIGNKQAGVPFLIETPDRDRLYPALRVTSVRVEPCADALDLESATNCERQVRLTVQPLNPDGSNDDRVNFLDASVHLFYALDDERFVDLLLGLRELAKENAGNPPLSAHPVMARQGLGGPWTARLHDLVAGHCGGDNLVRMTLMATGRSGNNWFWHALQRQADGSFAHDTIPELGGVGDGWVTLTRDDDEREHPPTPPGVRFPDDALNTATIRTLDDAALAKTIDELRRLQNPNLTSSKDTACSSCHAAETVLEHVLAVRGLSPEPTPSSFVAPPGQNVGRAAPSPTFLQTNLHAFSYFGTTAAVSQRAVNESARVAAHLGSEAFARGLSPAARAKWLAAQ